MFYYRISLFLILVCKTSFLNIAFENGAQVHVAQKKAWTVHSSILNVVLKLD